MDRALKLLFRAVSLQCHPDKTADERHRALFVSCNAAAKKRDLVTLAAAMGSIAQDACSGGACAAAREALAHDADVTHAVEWALGAEERKQVAREAHWCCQYDRMPPLLQRHEVRKLVVMMRMRRELERRAATGAASATEQHSSSSNASPPT